MAITAVADLYQAVQWINGVRDQRALQNSILRSGIITGSNEVLAQLIAAASKTIEVPFYVPVAPSGQLWEENTEPSAGKLDKAMLYATRLDRAERLDITDKATIDTDLGDPITEIFRNIAEFRDINDTAILLAILKGAFGSEVAGAAAGDQGNMYTFSINKAIEDGDNAAAADLFTSNNFLDAIALFGEDKRRLGGGVLYIHSDIETAISKSDESTTVMDSEGRLTVTSYKGVPVMLDDNLARDGGTSGKIYTTYIGLPGSVNFNEAPQGGTAIGTTGSLILDVNERQGNAAVIDRRRLSLHLNGQSWNTSATLAGGTAANGELSDVDNWTLGIANAKHVGMTRLTTNG